MPGFGQVHLHAFFIDPEVALGFGFLGLWFARHARHLRGHLIETDVERGVVFGLARDDQGGARLVDQNRIDLIDNGVVQSALAAVFDAVLHIVTQVVKAVFVVGAVGDVGGVGGFFLFVVLLRDNHAHAHAQELIQRAHPFGVAAREVIVHRHHVHALARERIQVDGECGHQGLALARAHFGNLAVMQRNRAQHLYVKMAHAKDALARLAHDGEGFG